MKHSRQAFTLIELLVVVSIISILTALAAVSYTTVQQRGRDAQRKNDLNQIKIALSTYYGAQVPAAFVTAASKSTINSSTDTLSAALEPNYIKNVPLDPLNTGNNVYKYQSFNSAADFKLFGTLENKNDSKGWGTGSSWVADGLIIQNE
jgi:prepilin-type N-terminal cleavage/methylation domain-containing protein